MDLRTTTKEELCLFEATPEPCAIVIFGASGDLTDRKLLPSLYHLHVHNLLPKTFFIIGVSRTPFTDEAFRARVKAAVGRVPDSSKVDDFVRRAFYLSGDYNNPRLYADLKSRLAAVRAVFGGADNTLFYLATPPSVYGEIVSHLGQSELTKFRTDQKPWSRVVIEKPFGHSLASALLLQADIQRHLDEKQIYRIDHYLGKETVQNILMFRFANIIFEPVWNRNYIDHVRIEASETMGVEHRAGYYEQAGIWRDMFQNHLLQLTALTAMEPPSSLDADTVRDRRLEVLRSVHRDKPADIPMRSVAGQYGSVGVNGEPVPGYRDEPNVAKNSRVPTFGALCLTIDNWRWAGVPFIISSGKRLRERVIEISIAFKKVPVSIFKPLTADNLAPNQLTFRIQPNEGIQMRFEAKKPGPKLCMATVHMDFGFEEAFKTPQPESYARLFLDALKGDQTLFARSDEIVESWRIMDPIVNYWSDPANPEPSLYAPGSDGPDVTRLFHA